MRYLGEILYKLLENGYWSAFVFMKMTIDKEVFRFTSLPFDLKFKQRADKDWKGTPIKTFEDGTTIDYNDFSASTEDHIGIISFSPQNLSTSVDKAEMSVVLADPHFILRPYARDASISGKLEIRGGIYNTTGKTLNYHYNENREVVFTDYDENQTIINGNTLTNPTIDDFFFRHNEAIFDPLQTYYIYKGYISRITYALGESKGIVAEVEASSPMGALDTNNLWFTSISNLRQKKLFNSDAEIEGIAFNQDTCISTMFNRNARVSLRWGQQIKSHPEYESQTGVKNTVVAYETEPDPYVPEN